MVIAILVQLFGSFPSYFLMMKNTTLEFLSLQYLLTLIAFVIVPAILGELVFRGIFLENFESENTHTMVLLSGVYFGLIHTGIVSVIYGFIVGLVLGFIFIKQKNIIGSTIAHIIINGYTLHYFINTSTNMTNNTIYYGLIIFSILVIVLLIFFKYNDRINPKRIGYKPLDIDDNLVSKITLSVISFGVMILVYIKF